MKNLSLLTFATILLAILYSCSSNKDDKNTKACCSSVPQSSEQVKNIKAGPSCSSSCTNELHTQIAWAHQFGDSSDDFGKSIGIDNENNIYVGGWTNGAFGGSNSGGFDILLLKTDQLGNIAWKKQFGSSADEQTEEISVDSQGNISITGWTKGDLAKKNTNNNDIFVAEYDKNGEKKWIRQFGTDSIDSGIFIEQDEAGNKYITGYTAGSLASQNLGKRDIILLKLAPEGELIFKTQFGTENTDIGHGLHLDNEGNIYVCGVTGSYWDEPDYEKEDLFLAKLDSNGKLLWKKSWGTPKADLAMNVKVDGVGNLYIGGTTSGNYGGDQAGQGDAFIGKFDSNGENIWLRQFGRDKWDCVMNIVFAKDDSGDILISGCQNWNQCEGYCRRYSSEGELKWVEEFAGDGKERSTCGKDVIIDNQNNIYHTGGTNTSLFSENKGKQDVYIVKLREHKP